MFEANQYCNGGPVCVLLGGSGIRPNVRQAHPDPGALLQPRAAGVFTSVWPVPVLSAWPGRFGQEPHRDCQAATP